MIWYNIVGAILLIAIILILSSIWEVSVTKLYTYDPAGKEKVSADNLAEYNICPDEVLKALKNIYAEDYRVKYIKFKDKPNCDALILETMRFYYLPAKVHHKKSLQVSDYWWEAARAITGFIAAGMCAIALIAMIGTNIGNKCSWAVDEQTVKYEEEIVSLENNKQYIITYYSSGVNKDIDISSTNIPTVIKEHNAQVKDLITKIKVDKINLKNPWISPWVNPACEKVDLLRVQATYINTLI